MAAEKTTRKRPRPAASQPDARESTQNLRLRKDPRKEWRYQPTSTGSAWITMLGMSIGGVVLGAGVYGQWLRSYANPTITEPHPYAGYLLLGGALFLAAVALFGPRQAKPIRVGDAGVGREKDGTDVERIEWRDVTRILLDGDMLTFQGTGAVIAIPLKQHPQAAARALSEAKRRIPKKLEDVDGSSVPKLDDDEGEVVPLEKPQLAGARCKASDELIAFEKDARLCGVCGEVYHKAHVPERCLTCDAVLK
jgi:hypothetical protein